MRKYKAWGLSWSVRAQARFKVTVGELCQSSAPVLTQINEPGVAVPLPRCPDRQVLECLRDLLEVICVIGANLSPP
jgi:hypothetical protein